MTVPTPGITGTSDRVAAERTFKTHDDTQLFYRHWPALTPAPKGAVILFHRGHEHSGRMAHLVGELGLTDYAFYAWDARGLGRSAGERGGAPSFGAVVRDVDCFIRHISITDGIRPEDMAMVAQSVGAALVTAWAHDYAPRIRAMVLASPAFSVKLYVPLARPGLKLMHMLRGDFFVNSYVKPQFLTHDPERIASYRTDPLMTRPISVSMLLGLYEASDRVVADARAITIPTQLLISGADWVVRHKPQHDFFVNLGSRVKERHVLPGFYHDTLGERDRAGAVEKMRDFLTRCFAAPIDVRSLRDADKVGFTRDEADRLATPLPLASPRGAYWAFTRLSMKIGALFSNGMATGERTGYDSGSMLDYIYRNEARGLGPIGRSIDRIYIDAIGWRGIRQRKVHVEAMLADASARLRAAGAPVRVLDIAAGHGRYVLEAVEKAATRPDSIVLRDYSDLNVNGGRKLIAQKGLQDIARFEQADAFDPASIAGTDPKPTVGVVSGLYELFSDNDMVTRSLGGLAEAIAPGGYLVYTGQPWHPQLELIARGLTSHRQGAAWIMRRRTQSEMDQLVEAAGFEKIDQRIDTWGIFTVSLARRKAS